MSSTSSLEDRFSIPEVVRFEDGPHHLRRIVVNSTQAEAVLYLHGAHLTHYQPRSSQIPVLFMSLSSLFDPKKAIRGGIPVIFPWFGSRKDDPSSPAHGFARLKDWSVESINQTSEGAVIISLELKTDETTKATWADEFTLRYSIYIGAALGLSLEVCNTSHRIMNFEEAFHTYFTVSDVRKITVEGLENTTYVDKVDRFQRKQEGLESIRITGETDRVYLNTSSTCVIDDPGAARQIIIEKNGSDATVLWNPWIEKAKAMSDFGDDEWQKMVCIETCNVSENAITLLPGKTHTMKTLIRVEPRK